MIFSFATWGSTLAQGVVSTSALDQLPNCAVSLVGLHQMILD
jgi:hypothetical protein